MKTEKLDLTQIGDESANQADADLASLLNQFDAMTESDRFGWSANLRLKRKIGRGGQSIVWLAERLGSDGFQIPVAAKFFSPDPYKSAEEYDSDMARIASVASVVAALRDLNFIDVHHFLIRDRIRVMITEWINGFDLQRLLTNTMFGIAEERMSQKRWAMVNQNVVTGGAIQPRMQPEAVCMILIDCLRGLNRIHQAGIIHGDIKPSNVMLDCNAVAKIIDIGASITDGSTLRRVTCTPTYAAPQTIQWQEISPQTDVVSLGYVGLELLTGRSLFDPHAEVSDLTATKLDFSKSFARHFPEYSSSTSDLWECLKSMIDLGQSDIDFNRVDQEITSRFLDDLRSTTEFSNLEDSRTLMAAWIDELLDVSIERDLLPTD